MTDSVKREQKSLSMCGELVTPTHIFDAAVAGM